MESPMARVLVSDKLSDQGLAILKAGKGLEIDVKTGLPPEEIVKIIGGYDAWIVRSATKCTPELIAAADQLKIIARAGIGVDNVDLPAATKKGVVVMNTPSGNAVTTAEHAIAMMFSIARKIPQATASVKTGKWEKNKFMGTELCNKNLGIIGVGNIGKIVASRALGLKMKVLGFDPFLSKEAADKLGVELVELDDLFKRADFITIHVPFSEKTKNLVNKDAFQKMKKGVYVINCARGGIVNEADLKVALDEGKVRGAALDVFEKEPPSVDHPLLSMDNVIYTPHLGAATDEAQENVAIEVAELVVDYFGNGTIKNAVNFPSVTGEMSRILKPYIDLAEKLGSLQGQLLDRLPEEVSIEYRGEISEFHTAPVTQALLKGLLSALTQESQVNYVNASLVAKEKGLKIIESKVRDNQDFTTLISLTVKTGSDSRTVAGSIFGKKNPRLVQIGSFYLEAIPEGTILVIHNQDKPGVVGKVGTFLGERGINISRMQLGLEKGKSEAIALYNVEGDISKELLADLAKVPNVISVKKVCL